MTYKYPSLFQYLTFAVAALVFAWQFSDDQIRYGLVHHSGPINHLVVSVFSLLIALLGMRFRLYTVTLGLDTVTIGGFSKNVVALKEITKIEVNSGPRGIRTGILTLGSDREIRIDGNIERFAELIERLGKATRLHVLTRL